MDFDLLLGSVNTNEKVVVIELNFDRDFSIWCAFFTCDKDEVCVPKPEERRQTFLFNSASFISK